MNISFEPKGLIFDCDGTIADTMPSHWQAWNAVASRHGFAFTRAKMQSLGGIPSHGIVKILSEEQGLNIDAVSVARDKEALFLPMIAHVVPVHPVLEIARMNYGKVPMAIASGGSRRIIEIILNHLGIRNLFSAVVTHEDVIFQKPAPDIFLEAARRIGIPPSQCRAFEDTDIGLQSIRSAGMDAVDVRDILADCCPQ